MSLHVIVAYDGPGGSANPSVIYCGRSGDAARAAMDANTSAVRFERIQNPTVIRKHNVNYAPPVAATPPAEPVASLPPLTVQPEPDNRRGRR